MSATIYITYGYGIQKIKVYANDFVELQNMINEVIETYNNKTTMFLGITSFYEVIKVRYFYPTGKTYTKIFK